MIRASCHCGAVVVEADSLPATVTSCNCSICRRIAGLWAYYKRSQARLIAGHDAVAAYVWEEIAPLRVRHFDGADTWTYLD